MKQLSQTYSTFASLNSLTDLSYPKRPDKCRFIPSLSSFDDIQTRFQTVIKENDENTNYSMQGDNGSAVTTNAEDELNTDKNIFHQILKNNLFRNKPRPMILTNRSSTSVDNFDSLPKEGFMIDETYRTERKIASTPFKVLDAPNLQDDYYLNVVDWSNNYNLAVGLGQALYIWNYHTNQVKKLTEFFGRNLLTSVSWDLKSDLLGIGSKEGVVSLWDGVKEVSLRKFYEHSQRVGALSLFGPMLLTGSKDKNIILRDTRMKSSVVQKFTSHKQEICGLKWSPDGNYFASGGNDNKLCVFSPKTIHPLMKKSHKAAVKGIAWSSRRVGLLASGAGTADRGIRVWNMNTMQMLAYKETGSQVCNLAFSKHTDEIVSTHGFSNNEICIWNWKDFRKVKTLRGHLSRVLYLAMSPCGQYIVSGAGDETLRFWNMNYEEEVSGESREQLSFKGFENKPKDKRLKKTHRISKLGPSMMR